MADNYLFNDDPAPSRVVGFRFDPQVIVIKLEDGRILSIKDDEQLCCEDRYFTYDHDDYEHLVNGYLLSVLSRDCGEAETDAQGVFIPDDDDADFDTHEVNCIEIRTNTGFATIFMHNEHNGYYGGFKPVLNIAFGENHLSAVTW